MWRTTTETRGENDNLSRLWIYNEMRPTPDEFLANLVKEIAKRSTCLRHQDGALITRGLHIISIGYNGTPTGLVHCEDIGCLRAIQYVPSGQRHELCRGAHADINAIVFAAKYGISVEGATMWCSRHPCTYCAKAIVNAGISEVVYLEDYPDDLSKEMLQNIIVRRYDDLSRM